MSKLVSLSLFLLSFSRCSDGPEQPAIFRRANEQLRKGDYPAAILLYQQLERQGVVQPALYRNTATAFYKAGRVGWAAYYFEKATALAPLNSQLITNAAQLHKPTLGTPIESAIELNPASALKAADIGIQAAVFGLLVSSILFLLSTIAKGRRQHNLVVSCRYLLLATAPLLVFSCGIISCFYIENEAIIILPKATARSGPSNVARKVFEPVEGEKVLVQKHYGKWLKIRAKSGEEGWITNFSAARLAH